MKLYSLLSSFDNSTSPVSIPKRVSEALKPALPAEIRFDEVVSIPKRVSEALKQIIREIESSVSSVSIPKRVSEALKLPLALQRLAPLYL